MSSEAHVDVMRAIKPGMAEYQLEALFCYHIYDRAGCRSPAYTCICACGPNAGTLHYGHAGAPNSRILKETDIALVRKPSVMRVLSRQTPPATTSPGAMRPAC